MEAIATLLPYSPAYEQQAERQFGILQGKGKVEFHDDFAMTEDMLLALDLNNYFNLGTRANPEPLT